jgi:hypothetical protein
MSEPFPEYDAIVKSPVQREPTPESETNDSAVKVLGDETLRGIARELVETVRNNVTIDWTLRENVRAQLRVLVKRILRKHGYPPDKQEKATQTVLEQAALQTPGVRKEPQPYVYQQALSDFYVEYELFVSIDRPIERIPIQSGLHAAIQDVFNEHGVQIMSPHFFAQPEQAVVVPKADWFKAPAG